jgi:hypothetical protein
VEGSRSANYDQYSSETNQQGWCLGLGRWHSKFCVGVRISLNLRMCRCFHHAGLDPRFLELHINFRVLILVFKLLSVSPELLVLYFRNCATA